MCLVHKTTSFDLQRARYDPIDRLNSDDLALEIVSVIETGKQGWALRDDAQTDLVLFLYPSGRYKLISFCKLREALRQNLVVWIQKYKYQISPTEGKHAYYHSMCLFVPRKVVEQAVRDACLSNN